MKTIDITQQKQSAQVEASQELQQEQRQDAPSAFDDKCLITMKPMHEQAFTVWEHFKELHSPDGAVPVLYRNPTAQDGTIPPGLFVPQHDNDALRTVTASYMPIIFDAHFRITKTGGGKQAQGALMRYMLENPDASLPEIRGITHMPVILRKRDGGVRLLDKPGYDWESGLYYIPDRNLKVELFSSAKTARDYVFKHWLHDIPFKGGRADAATFLAFLLHPYVRHMISEGAPAYLVEAAGQTAAKSLVVELASMVWSGKIKQGPTWSEDQMGFDHKLSAWFMTPGNAQLPLMFFDNAKDNTELDSPSMARMITQGEHTDRPVRGAATITWPARHAIVVTGNRITLSDDLQPRFLTVTVMHSEAAKKGEYKIPHIKKWTSEPANRSKLTSALLTIALEGLQTGTTQSAPLYEKFPAWRDVMWPIMANIGFTEFLTTVKANRKIDEQLATRNKLWQLLREVAGSEDKAMKPGALMTEISRLAANHEELALLPFMTVPEPQRAGTLGSYLGGLRGANCDGVSVHRIEKNGSRYYFREFAYSKPVFA